MTHTAGSHSAPITYAKAHHSPDDWWDLVVFDGSTCLDRVVEVDTARGLAIVLDGYASLNGWRMTRAIESPNLRIAYRHDVALSGAPA